MLKTLSGDDRLVFNISESYYSYKHTDVSYMLNFNVLNKAHHVKNVHVNGITKIASKLIIIRFTADLPQFTVHLKTCSMFS